MNMCIYMYVCVTILYVYVLQIIGVKDFHWRSV